MTQNTLKSHPKTKEEIELENTVFGKIPTKINKYDQIEKTHSDSESTSDSESSTTDSDCENQKVWSDSDDIPSALENVAEEKPKWTKTKNKRPLYLSSASNTKLLRSNGQLPADQFDIFQAGDEFSVSKGQSLVTDIDFNSSGGDQLLISHGNGEIRIFDINQAGISERKLIKTPKTKIYCAKFINGGKEIVFSSTKGALFVVDLPSGTVDRLKNFDQNNPLAPRISTCGSGGKLCAVTGPRGQTFLVSVATKRQVGVLKINGKVSGVCFSFDGRLVYSVGDDSEMYQWDVLTRRCVDKLKNTQSVHSTCVAVSPCGSFLAVGSDSGDVSLYRDKRLIKSVGNLVTKVTGLLFNSTSEFLVAFSSRKSNALKIIHLASLTVYSGWPKPSAKLGKVTSVALEPNSRLLAVGNLRGRVQLFKIPFYSNK